MRAIRAERSWASGQVSAPEPRSTESGATARGSAGAGPATSAPHRNPKQLAPLRIQERASLPAESALPADFVIPAGPSSHSGFEW